LGHVQTEVFTADGVKVVATFKSTFVCPVSVTSCEVTRYDVKFSVIAGDQKQVVKGVGSVGC